MVRARAVLPSGLTPELVDIQIEGGRIVALNEPSDRTRHFVDVDLEIVDPGAVVTAGFIDVHTHGAIGVQVIDGRGQDVCDLAQFYARHGVTGFLATIGGSREHIEAGIAAVAAHRMLPTRPGAHCLGVHLEGPFINLEQLGAFQRDSVSPAETRLFDHYADLAAGELKLITIAPELPGADSVIDAAVRRDIRCSAGHSAATSAQMLAAIDNGVGSVTHMFNAMSAFHHRTPGIAGVALTDPRLIAEAIADGIHVDPVALRLLVLAKGVEGIALITDSIGATGLPDGDYVFEEQAMSVHNGAARLADGTLAGSTLTMDQAISQFSRFGVVPWERAAVSATAVPARLLGLGHRKGRIAVGVDADLVAVRNEQQVDWTMVAGEIVYRRPAA